MLVPYPVPLLHAHEQDIGQGSVAEYFSSSANFRRNVSSSGSSRTSVIFSSPLQRYPAGDGRLTALNPSGDLHAALRIGVSSKDRELRWRLTLALSGGVLAEVEASDAIVVEARRDS
jgi:hypothetical protein